MQRGTHLTEEHKEKIRLAHIGKKLSDDTKEKIRKIRLIYWKKISDEEKNKQIEKRKEWFRKAYEALNQLNNEDN